ncbi:MAG TPA: vWA domain-containing protein [Thermoanaerobaculia bacterium]|nr:vWA domain-containing protein [Thermoanaerobaculia bacterium]
MRCLRGASSVHVVLSDASGVRLRAEIGAEPGEIVPLRVELDGQTTPHLSSRGRNVLLLPPDVLYEPAAPIRPPQSDAPLDLVIVIDGTLRNWPAKAADNKQAPTSVATVRLLDHTKAWNAHVDQLLVFATRVAAGRETRVAVLAFGDQEMPAVTATDLRPAYRLHPAEDERILKRLNPTALREKLLTLPSTSGGDFVDALADALEACQHLRWREGARKLVLVSGDSPGLSLLHPLPRGADLCVRQYDVDTEALVLHRRGVEIATIYHGPPPDLGFYKLPRQRSLLQATRAQYDRLASVPEASYEASAFRPEEAADLFLQMNEPIGRRAALGELVRVSEPVPIAAGA